MYDFFEGSTHFFIVLSSILCFVLCYQKKQYRHFLLFGFLAITIYIIEKYGGYLSNIGIYNVWLYNYETIIEYSTLTFILTKSIGKTNLKKSIRYLIFVMIAIGLYRIKYVLKEIEFDNFIYAFGNILTVFTSLYCLYEIFLYPVEISLQKQPLFWFCMSIILFNTTTFTLVYLHNNTFDFPKAIVRNLSIFNYILYSTSYLIKSIAFLCQIKTKISFI